MPTELVDAVRACLKQLDRLPSARERALLVALIARTDGTGRDVVDALLYARARMVHPSSGPLSPDALRLLAAVDAVLDPVPDGDRRLNRAPTPRGELREELTYRRDVYG